MDWVSLRKTHSFTRRYGHEVGDQVLAAIGGRLQSASRAGDFVARLGGDEFVVLSHAPHGGDVEAAAHAMRDRLQAETTGRFALAGTSIDYAGPSIGMVVAAQDGRDPEALLAQADAAMCVDKRLRKAVRETV
ncbi:GGDEF domain-containing protein [Dyella sp. BiH032]|uniref:GGDEF domain-containing protein n=1 Tax=Dyella sp. BiH032 TaxID=3075430 RepID=UPI002892EF8A|nr:GGDEF domain-containing protein [Dyella sp. BiH032]WNL45979.1 GGDEF domain-containing protein [Dyella sp. BiH032]